MERTLSSVNVHNTSLDDVNIASLFNPFPGLRPFNVDENHLFFGREGQGDEILEKLTENNFVAILGVSGSGKSSLIYSGLIPSLYGGYFSGKSSEWTVITTRPGNAPISNLAEALLSANSEYRHKNKQEKMVQSTIVDTFLRSSSLGLIDVIQQLESGQDQNTLILIDQFEELFRFRGRNATQSELEESSVFVNLLIEAVNQSEVPIFVAITMRSDFIGECAQFPDLTHKINDSHYLIPQMTRDQKRRTIEGPIAVCGGKISSRLTQQLLNDVGEKPDQLPILQHALMRTWSFWTKERKQGEPLDIRHYNAIGGLQQALSMHANEAYDSLNKRQQEICEIIFKALTEKNADNQGIRRPTKLSVIASIAGVNEDEAIKIIDKFREPGRSLLMPPHNVPIDSNTIIDVSHESLMRIWIRLKKWLNEEFKASEMYLKLSEAAERYQEGRSGLWQMPDLQLALNWREENKPTLVWTQRYAPAFERTMVFLEISERAFITRQRNKEILQRRQLRRMRAITLFVTLAALVAITFLIYANIKANQAEKNLIEATKQEQEANDQRIRAEELSEKARKAAADAKTAQAFAEEQTKKAEEATTQARRNAEEARKQADLAQDALRKAEKATSLARTQEKIAQEKSDLATVQQRKAERASKAANWLRYRAIAQSMALKAKTIVSGDRSNAELKALVANKAHSLYEKYKDEGKDYNGDIYAAVYTGMKGLYEVEADEKSQGDSAFNQFKKSDHKNLDNISIGVKTVVFSPDGNYIYASNSNGEIVKWNFLTREHEVLYTSYEIIKDVAYSHDRKYLVVANAQNEIFVYNLNNSVKKPIKINHSIGNIREISFSPDDSGFFVTGMRSAIIKFDLKGNALQSLITPVLVNSIDISEDSKKLIGGGVDGKVYVWDLEKDIYITVGKKKSGIPVSEVKISSDQKYVYYGDLLGDIVIWNLEKDIQYGPTLKGFAAPISDIESSPDSRLILATSSNKQARVWDIKNIYDLPIILEDYSDWVTDAAFSPNGRYFVTSSLDGIIRKYPVDIDEIAYDICDKIQTGNLSDNEWLQYVGEGLKYEKVCQGKGKRENN